MRKRIITQGGEGVSAAEKNWLDLEGLAQAEVSSEDVAHPIESALIPNTGSGWRAAQPGKQLSASYLTSRRRFGAFV